MSFLFSWKMTKIVAFEFNNICVICLAENMARGPIFFFFKL